MANLITLLLVGRITPIDAKKSQTSVGTRFNYCESLRIIVTSAPEVAFLQPRRHGRRHVWEFQILPSQETKLSLPLLPEQKDPGREVVGRSERGPHRLLEHARALTFLSLMCLQLAV